MLWMKSWLKLLTGPIEKKCPGCGTINDAKAKRCSQCWLDLGFLDYVMKLLTGNYPEIDCNPYILEPAEVAHLSAEIWITSFRNVSASLEPSDSTATEPCMRNTVDMPQAGSFNKLCKGLLVATNQRILIVTGEETYSVTWRGIRHFDLDAKSVRIFHDGRHSGDIYHMEDTRSLWWLYYSKLRLKSGGLLESPDLNDVPDDERRSILSTMNDMERARQRAQTKHRSSRANRKIALLIMFLLIVIPPMGFRLVFTIRSLTSRMKIGLFVFGLCSVFSWMLIVFGLTKSFKLV